MNKVETFLSENQIYHYQTDGFVNGGPLITGDKADHLSEQIEQVISDKDNPDVPNLLKFKKFQSVIIMKMLVRHSDYVQDTITEYYRSCFNFLIE